MHVGSPRSDLVQGFVAQVGLAGIAAFQVLAGKQDGHDQERGMYSGASRGEAKETELKHARHGVQRGGNAAEGLT